MNIREIVWKHTHIHKVANPTTRIVMNRYGSLLGYTYRFMLLRRNDFCLLCGKKFKSYKFTKHLEKIEE